jgi:hypothetical protein
MTNARHGGSRPLNAFAIGLIVIAVFQGCGVKAPPMPPQTKALPVITNLTFSRSGDTVTLIWHETETPSVSSYDIYSSRIDLSDPPCEGCPVLYEKTGSVSVNGKEDRGHTLQFEFSMVSGFRYLFKVKSHSASGALGPDSNIVEVECD